MKQHLINLFITFFISIPSVFAVSVFPNKITTTGVIGTKTPIQFKIYGHFETASIEFVKVIDLQKNEDKIISEFVLGKEQERIIPIDIIIKDNSKYYLCAVLKDSQSMRLRTCSIVTTKVSQ
jgi:hypothetical protein